MGAIILLVVGMIIGGVVAYKLSDWPGPQDFVLGSVLGLLPAFLIVVVISLCIRVEEVKVDEIPLQALKDGSQSEGSFFLGSGTVEGSEYYFFVKETDRGMKRDKVNADYVYIIEDEDEEPRMEVYTNIPATAFGKFMFDDGVIGSEEDRTYSIIVPNGTVTNEFSIDLE